MFYLAIGHQTAKYNYIRNNKQPCLLTKNILLFYIQNIAPQYYNLPKMITGYEDASPYCQCNVAMSGENIASFAALCGPPKSGGCIVIRRIL